MRKLKAILSIIKSENYILITTDKVLQQRTQMRGIGNTLYKMIDLFMLTHGNLLKDNTQKFDE